MIATSLSVTEAVLATALGGTIGIVGTLLFLSWWDKR